MAAAHLIGNSNAKRHGFCRGKGKYPIRQEYNAWSNMIQRCTNPSAHSYRTYGARGITVCDRWLSVQNFIADMGPKPTPQHQLERIDNNGNYCPENCRWATRKEQNRNRQYNVRLTHNGQTKLLVEWAEQSGIKPGTIRYRLRIGWSVEQALTTPFAARGPSPKLIAFDGREMSIDAWAEELGIAKNVLYWRFENWPFEKAMTVKNTRRVKATKSNTAT